MPVGGHEDASYPAREQPVPPAGPRSPGSNRGAAAASDLVVFGTTALRAANWAAARDAFQSALRHSPSHAEALAGLGLACWWLNELDESLRLRERAYVAFRRRGDPRGAASMAMWLARQHALVRGNGAAYSGWMARADRLLQSVEVAAEHGWLVLFQGCSSSDPSSVEAAARTATEMATRFGDADLEWLARAYSGLAHVAAGQVQAGMLRLDEAMAAASGGDVADYNVIGEIYCTLLSACERACDPERAQQWRRVIDEFVRQYDHTAYGATCRTFYGSLLTAAGRWPDAERELLAAIQSFEAGSRAMRVDAIVRLALLRVRQGRLEEADGLLEAWGEHPEAAIALAALHLARGEAELADVLLERRVRQLGPLETLQAAPALLLLGEAQLARGDLGAACATAERLAAMARACAAEAILGMAELAVARVCVARCEDPVPALERALAHFARADMPFEAGQARLLLAEALSERSPHVAIADARTALASFERLGAARGADAAARLLRRLGVGGRTGTRAHAALSAREEDVLRLLGQGLSNEQIAGRLVISRRTAEHHVSAVLSKLGLDTRAQVAAYAARRDASALARVPAAQESVAE